MAKKVSKKAKKGTHKKTTAKTVSKKAKAKKAVSKKTLAKKGTRLHTSHKPKVQKKLMLIWESFY
jgi:hypothetical protein